MGNNFKRSNIKTLKNEKHYLLNVNLLKVHLLFSIGNNQTESKTFIKL